MLMGSSDRKKVRILNRRGFTLVELIIVVAIVGILLSIGTLSYKTMLRRYNAEKQTKELYVDLMNTRLRAMQRARDQFVSLQSATMYRIYEDSPVPGAFDGDRVFSTATDSLISTYALLPSFGLMLKTNPAMTLVQFTSKGLVDPGQTGVVYISLTPGGDAGGANDCVVIGQIKTSMGKWNGTTNQCDIR